MKTKTIIIILGLVSGLPYCYALPIGACGDTTVLAILTDVQTELEQLTKSYLHEKRRTQSRLREIRSKVGNRHSRALPEEELVILLWERMDLKEQLEHLDNTYQGAITETRYRKGLELIKLLYEKILGLDHHFTSLQTYQNVALLSNPHSFPDFQQSRFLLESRLKKKKSINLPGFLETNPFISATYSLLAGMIGEGPSSQKEEELGKISCILDFTLRMNNELNTIYYETEFLKEGNKALKEECLSLFAEYVQPIDYFLPLNECRRTDDWERVLAQLSAYTRDMMEYQEAGDEISQEKAYRKQVELEFAVDRLLDFINRYTAFISQGEKYYQKFHIIISNYQNESVCLPQLPDQFATLKKDINLSIEKFNESYNIAELKGSRMKDLLYGLSN